MNRVQSNMVKLLVTLFSTYDVTDLLNLLETIVVKPPFKQTLLVVTAACCPNRNLAHDFSCYPCVCCPKQQQAHHFPLQMPRQGHRLGGIIKFNQAPLLMIEFHWGLITNPYKIFCGLNSPLYWQLAWQQTCPVFRGHWILILLTHVCFLAIGN